MNRPLESDVERYLSARVRQEGGLTEKLTPTRAGMPDRLVLLPMGRSYLVELKRDPREGLRAIQRVWHERAASLGTDVVVLRGRREIDLWLLERREELNALIDEEVS